MSPARTILFLMIGGATGGLLGSGLIYGLSRLAAPPAGVAAPPPAAPAPQPPTADADGFKREAPPFRGLDANLYLQTAAEYRACCLQAYALAEQRLRSKVALKSRGGRPAAVVFDLDETVLDNGGFQTDQVRAGRAYDPTLWDRWEETGGGRVGLVPGAKEFILKLRGFEVTPVYISNRKDQFREQTHAVLKRHGIDVPDAHLLLATKTSDKTDRRAAAAAAFDVLLLVGDNLRDFDDVFRYDQAKGAAARAAAVDARRDRFGDDWIILPNPAYGEWTKPFPGGAKDADLLRPNPP